MGIRVHRVVAWSVAAAGLAALAVTADSCARRGDDLPARIWVPAPLPGPAANLASLPDVRLTPGGARTGEFEAVWCIVSAPGAAPEPRVHALRPLSLVDRVVLFVRHSVGRSTMAVYRPTGEVVSAGGAEWGGLDREPSR